MDAQVAEQFFDAVVLQIAIAAVELQRAIDDVNRQEKLPISYDELVPRRELAPWAHALALLLVALLLAALALAIRRWA